MKPSTDRRRMAYYRADVQGLMPEMQLPGR